MPICMYHIREASSTFLDGFLDIFSRFYYHYYDSIQKNFRINFMPDSQMQRSLVCYAWEIHLMHLTDDIEHTQRIGLENPTVDSLRRINVQRRHVQQAAKDIEKCLELFEPDSHTLEPEPYNEHLLESRGLEGKAAALKQDINDITTLLIGSISVMDARDSRIQAERSTALTALAAIYLPLSLATGVFGMNIWEINKGSPKWWAVVALSLGLLVLTLAVLAWIFIARRGCIRIARRSNLVRECDTSRLERGSTAYYEENRRSGKEKYVGRKLFQAGTWRF